MVMASPQCHHLTPRACWISISDRCRFSVGGRTCFSSDQNNWGHPLAGPASRSKAYPALLFNGRGPEQNQKHHGQGPLLYGRVGWVERSDIRRKAAALFLVINAANPLTPQTLVRDATRAVQHSA